MWTRRQWDSISASTQNMEETHSSGSSIMFCQTTYVTSRTTVILTITAVRTFKSQHFCELFGFSRQLQFHRCCNTSSIRGEHKRSIWGRSTNGLCLISGLQLKENVGAEDLTLVVMKSSVLWHITPFSPLEFNRRFVETNIVHPQGWRLSQAGNKRGCISKSRFTFNPEYGTL
jgi:hypothetical protein